MMHRARPGMKTKKTRTWACRYCKKVYKKKNDLQRHYNNNLWEANIKKLKNGRFKCIICDREFGSTKSFRGHWDDDHDDQALRDGFLSATSKGRKAYNWSIRPSELELIKQRIKTDRNKRALKNDFAVNDMVLDEFEYGIQETAMTVIEILGIPGVGKSVLGLTLARHLQMLWTQRLKEWWGTGPFVKEKLEDGTVLRYSLKFFQETQQKKFYLPTIRIGFNMDQTTKHIQVALKGDVVIQDEDPALAGINARSVQEQIENLLKIMREACINLIFISPETVSYVRTPSFVLEAIAKDVTRRLTIAAYFDRQHNAHGWTVYEILPENDPLMIYYKKMKRANINRIKKMAGKEGAKFDKDDLMRDATTLYNFVKESGVIDIDKTTVTKEFLKTMVMFVDNIKGSTKYIDAVAMTLKQILDTQRSISDIASSPGMMSVSRTSFITSDDEFLIELEEVMEDESFVGLMFEMTAEALEHKENCKDGNKKLHLEYNRTPLEKGVDKEDDWYAWKKYEDKGVRSKHAEAWYLYYGKNYPLQQVAEALSHHKADGELTASAIANSYDQGGWRAIYQEELSGYAAEVAFKESYCPDEDGWELVAGHGEIDIKNHEDETWVELKIRNRLKPKEKVEEQITIFEYQHVRDGKPFKLVRIGYVPNKPARIEIWNVTINPEWLAGAVEEELEMEEEEERYIEEEEEVV